MTFPTPPFPGYVSGHSSFSAARDEAGESRRQGGIHFPDADHNGRGLGASVDQAALATAQTCFNGTAPQP